MLDEVYFPPANEENWQSDRTQASLAGILAKPLFFPEIGNTSVSQSGYILFCLKTEILKPDRVRDEGAAST